MDTSVTALQLAFVPPTNWMLDETLSPVGVRVKIENGVIFFKPAGAGMPIDVIELEFQYNSWRAILDMTHPLTDRLLNKLQRLGLSSYSTYFELHPAQRGWDGISLRPDHRRPINRPYLRARILTATTADETVQTPLEPVKLFNGPITAQDVEKVLAMSQ